MKNPNSPFSVSQDFPFSSSPFLGEDQASKRVNCLTERMTKSFKSEPDLPVSACDEIPDHALTACLERCRDVIGNEKIGEREFGLVQKSIRENLTGMKALKAELAEAEREHVRLKAKAEPFFEMMAPLLGVDDKPLTGLDEMRMTSLQETLTELVQALSFAEYRRDQLMGRMEALSSYVTDQVVESVQARNLGNPHLPQIRTQVWRAISAL